MQHLYFKTMNISIRKEKEKDYRGVEELTREAFWNLYVPGGNEHLLVHKLRKHKDFIPELDFVAEDETGKIIGNIMFSNSYILDSQGNKFETITFGPVSILPEFQKKGIGSLLIRNALKTAKDLGYKAVVIYGHPEYYKKFGFKSAKSFNITNPEGKFPAAHLILELQSGALSEISGKAYESEIFNISEAETEEFDKGFPVKEKKEAQTQKQFLEMVKTFL